MHMRRTTVINIKKTKLFDVYIGRGTKWGNPYRCGKHRARSVAVAQYEERLKRSPELMRDLHELKGKVLGCHCKPAQCHGDVLAKYADKT
jgi:hypothetical protein